MKKATYLLLAAVSTVGAGLVHADDTPTDQAQGSFPTPANQTQIVEGSFLIPPGTSNFMAYQGGGFIRALSEPIVLCQGKRGGG